MSNVRHRRSTPIVGILLGPSGLWDGKWLVIGGGGEYGPGFIVHQDGSSPRADIEAEDRHRTSFQQQGAMPALNSIAGETRVSAYRAAFEIKGVESATIALLRPGFFRLPLQEEFKVPSHHEVWGQGDLIGWARTFNEKFMENTKCHATLCVGTLINRCENSSCANVLNESREHVGCDDGQARQNPGITSGLDHGNRCLR